MNGRDRRIIYAISNVREIDKAKGTAHGDVPSTENGRGSHIRSSSTDGTIAQQKPPVKQKFSFDDEDYLLVVRAGDMDAAQEMVDEAAKATGYSIKAIHGTTKDSVEFGNKGEKTEAKSAYLAFWFSDSELTARAYSTQQATDVREESWEKAEVRYRIHKR